MFEQYKNNAVLRDVNPKKSKQNLRVNLTLQNIRFLVLSLSYNICYFLTYLSYVKLNTFFFNMRGREQTESKAHAYARVFYVIFEARRISLRGFLSFAA